MKTTFVMFCLNTTSTHFNLNTFCILMHCCNLLSQTTGIVVITTNSYKTNSEMRIFNSAELAKKKSIFCKSY